MNFFKAFIDNLVLVSCPAPIEKKIKRQKITPNDVETFLRHLKLVIPYFCQHPLSILESIEKLKENGLEFVVVDLHNKTQGNVQVWNGTIGEAIASAYIKSSTDYEIPVFKLRLAPNRKMAMHGDDLLGLKFNADGTPQELLVVEVKNYGAEPKKAVQNASDGLLKVQQGSITLLDFIINMLRESGHFNKAKQVKRFNDPYTYQYHTEYLAFIVTEQSKWKDEHFDAVVEGIQMPLTINAFLIPDWIAHQKQLVSTANQTQTKISLPEAEINELEEVGKLLNNSIFKNEQNQLASEAITIDLKNKERAFIADKYDPIKLEKAANFLGATGYNLLADASEEAEKVLKEAAVIHERLAILRLEDDKNFIAVDNIITSALLYSMAEYSNFKEWLFTLSFDRWKEIVQVEDENISKVEECFNDVQKKQRKLEKNSTVFDCSLVRINNFPKINEGIDKNSLIIVSFDEHLYITTYDYQSYWQLGGENVDKLRLFDRQIHDFIVKDIDQQREIVSISVY
jgi:Cap4 SAVED domain